MRGFSAIYGREMRAYFTSPTAYVVSVVFLLAVGLFFMTLLRNYISFDAYWRERLLEAGREAVPADVHQYLLRRFISTLGAITLFVLPFITMGSFAEEYRSGTMELLLTSPIGQRSIVLGKFAAASTVFTLLLLISLGLVSSLFLYGNPDPTSLLVGFVGVWLQGESFLVIGMFISSLTRSQVVAGIGGLGAALLLWLAGLLGDPTSTLGIWLNELSLVAHFEDFSKGILDSKHVVFYVCFIFFWLFLTLRSLESLKYR
ncbi:MAG: ABC transporter permease subunit [Candidatus Latescibacterota bacterium]|nr:MAG: ABC transporter permease subunit [Candidatus Latescibacterota bacterium]